MTVCSTTFVSIEVISVVIDEIDSTSSASESLTRRLPRAPVPNGNSILSEDRDAPIVKGRLDAGLLSLAGPLIPSTSVKISARPEAPGRGPDGMPSSSIGSISEPKMLLHSGHRLPPPNRRPHTRHSCMN